jgi:hypothetical protein
METTNITNVSPLLRFTYSEGKPNTAEICKRLIAGNTKSAGINENKGEKL